MLKKLIFHTFLSALLAILVGCNTGQDLAWTHNDNNIGRVYIASNSRTERAVTRGGNFSSGNSPGLFAADFDMLITGTGSSGGFRCAFSLD